MTKRTWINHSLSHSRLNVGLVTEERGLQTHRRLQSSVLRKKKKKKKTDASESTGGFAKLLSIYPWGMNVHPPAFVYGAMQEAAASG